MAEILVIARLTRPLLRDDSRISPRPALAICVAFECTADCTFAIFFERYYRTRRYHTDPAVNETAVRSGMADLFHWHGAEEFSHRHVAYEMMLAKGGTCWTRVAGFGIFTVLAVWLLLPAIISIRNSTTGHSGSKADGISASSVILITIWRTLRFLRPGFDPEKVEYDFLPDLARDAERFPVA